MMQFERVDQVFGAIHRATGFDVRRQPRRQDVDLRAARWAAIALLREAGIPWTAIARELGCDQTTARYAMKRFDRDLLAVEVLQRARACTAVAA